MLLHDGEVADDDLGARADEHLALATLLSVDNVVEAVGLCGRRGMTGSAFSRTPRRGEVNSQERRHAWLHGRKVHHDIECVPQARREKESENHSERGPVLTRDIARRVRAESFESECAEALVRTGQRCAVCRELVERGLGAKRGRV